jgi:putative heme-binding domain-containing protein
VQLLHDWIGDLGSNPNPDVTKMAAAAQQELRELQSAADGSVSASNRLRLEQVLVTPNGALAFMTALDRNAGGIPTNEMVHLANHPGYQVRELFERFLPPGQRSKRLGSQFRPEQIFALPGDPNRGRSLFFQESLQCSRCHSVQGKGTAFGPNLEQIGRKYPAAELLDQIINPSKRIEPEFTMYVVDTVTDQSYSGLIIQRTAGELVLKLTDAQEVHLPSPSVKSVRPQQLSAMPEGLLQALTAQQAADLLSFLQSLQ